MANQPNIQKGYLVLADLSGFTRFVASTELEHAQGILANLMRLLRSRLTPTLSLAEVEGDALFLYASGESLGRGETLLELIESTYTAFRDKQETMKRNATCPCQACQVMPTLDLKFVTHCGEYVLQDLTGAVKPFGSSVNLAHRLLKNRISESTGWKAYALFTEEALQQMGVRPDGMFSERVSYEHLGELSIGAMDLQRRYGELTAQRSVYLDADQAHFTVRRRYAATSAVLWDYLNDLHKRGLWEIGSDWSSQDRPSGRTGSGTHNHCANSDFIEEVLDWRPFDYFTVRWGRSFIRLLITAELLPDGDSTELRWSIAMEGTAPRPLRAAACWLMATRLIRAPERFERLHRMVASDIGLSSIRNGGSE
jgi:hypothetical protein